VHRSVALMLTVAAAIAYAANLTLLPGGDAAPHVLTAASWIVQGNANLDEYQTAAFHRQIVDGHVYSIYPPGTAAVIVAPLWLALKLGAQVDSPEFIAVFGKAAAVLLTALSVGLVYLACAALARPVPALVATVAYAFGTSVWAISSQQIWEHAPSHFFVALGTVLLTRPPRQAALAGLAYGLATVVRPTEAIVAVFGALVARRSAFLVRYLAWGVPAAAFLFLYTFVVFGVLRPTYPESDLPWAVPPPGWLGLLVSPSRGLFVYSPVLLFAVAGFVMAWRARPDRATRFVRDASLAVAATYVLYSFIGYWWGGWSFGTRYLSDVGPLFAIAVAFAIDRGAVASRVRRVVFAVALGWSILLEFAAEGWYYTFWNGVHWDVTPDIDLTAYRVWDWTDPQWWFVLRHLAAEPGFTIFPATLGAVLAAFLVLRAYRVQRRELAAAKNEQVVEAELKALVT
jgi:hypothetical protein